MFVARESARRVAITVRVILESKLSYCNAYVSYSYRYEQTVFLITFVAIYYTIQI